MQINGGGTTGFCWYSMTTVNLWNIQTWCEMEFVSLNILLNTAMRRFMSKMLAINKYIDIAIGVIQWPVIHGSWDGSSPQGGSISSANTCQKIKIIWIKSLLFHPDYMYTYLTVQHKVRLEEDISNKSPVSILVWI